jgi:AraC-like DNA-binding protein
MQQADGNINQQWMSTMGVSQRSRKYKIPKRRFRRSGLQSERASVRLAIRFLDAALRIWDEDQTQAKSQIKAAAAMLRGKIDEVPMQDPPAGRASQGLALWQVRKVEEFIDASLDSKIRLQDCADQTRLSASHFSRAFKATFGTTVLDYIHRRRIERSQQLMLMSEQSLSQIALSCGFADQAHYCRVFRAVAGVSPNAWRRQNMRETPADQANPEGRVANHPLGRRGWGVVSPTGRAGRAFRPVDQQESGQM